MQGVLLRWMIHPWKTLLRRCQGGTLLGASHLSFEVVKLM